ncbi:hypothetical protein CRG98_020380 [Punica granatum]|uniref:Uncharacterized protein n=1 Tax=Punica granatum TaxID=22663 RepID=A0A2I0JSC7_PUNGR|nr:hypothetical protein CRG98_020380 [Punica granatum]
MTITGNPGLIDLAELLYNYNISRIDLWAPGENGAHHSKGQIDGRCAPCDDQRRHDGRRCDADVDEHLFNTSEQSPSWHPPGRVGPGASAGSGLSDLVHRTVKGGGGQRRKSRSRNFREVWGPQLPI